MYLVLILLCIPIAWWWFKPNYIYYHQPIVKAKKTKPRKYRKWERYEKKDEWSLRYMKYVMSCRINSNVPYDVPLYRHYGIDELKMDALKTLYKNSIDKWWVD